LKYEAGKVGQLVNEVKQLGDVVSDGGRVGVDALEVLFEDLADALDALGHRLKVGISPRLWLLARLNE